jgi:hypothetical protein
MARLIPPAVDLDELPPGEQKVYQLLQSDPATEGWVALHSYDLPRHVGQVQGEADFVVIVPGLGVVCLEVKSHTSVTRRADGMWMLGGDPPERRGPFKQASDNMHSLKELLRQGAPALGRIPFISAVCFPRCSFDVAAREWHDWQVIDERTLSARPIGAALTAVLVQARRMFASLREPWFKGDDSPTPEQVQALSDYLRPRFEVHQSPRNRSKERADELRRYTEEQFRVLDVCELNRQVFIEGPAGTGKTFLAIEQARRFALQGRRVLLCCYNHGLSQWLRSECAPARPPFEVRTVHSLMREIAGVSPPDADDSSFWDQQLPALAAEALVAGHGRADSFDALVVDEAQDILFPPYLDVLDLVLKGGLNCARLVMFGDLQRQAIFRRDGYQPAEVLGSRFPTATRLPLRDNCRNTPRIGSLITQLAGGGELYRSFRRPDDGTEPTIAVWATPQAQMERLVAWLEAFRARDYAAGDVALLSPVREGCAAAKLPEPWASRIRPIESAQPGQGRFTTIAAFKGLEAAIIILTDIVCLATAQEESLLYVGMSRATDRLVILVSEPVRQDLIRLVIGAR